MTLATHTVIGVALTSLIPTHPYVGFYVAFTSHFLLDAIPHWDYHLLSRSIHPNHGDAIVFDRPFFLDMLRIGSDILFGLLISYLFFYQTAFTFAFGAGVVGALIPDFLQFVYGKFRHEPLISLQKFHIWIHSKIRLKDRPVIGVLSQIVFVGLFVFFLKKGVAGL